VSEEELGLLRDKGEFRTKEIANCLDANYWKGMDNRGARTQIINHQFRPKNRPSIQDGQSGGSGILFNNNYSYALSSSPHYITDVEPVITPDFKNKDQNKTNRVGSQEGAMFTVDGTSIHGIAEYQKPVEFNRNDGIGNELEVAHCLSSSDWSGLNRNQNQNAIVKKEDNHDHVRIRKLTPKECWRLQGFPDLAFDAAEEENSDTQLYKQAGNSVTVNVIEDLGERLVEYFENTEIKDAEGDES
jgi:site-specific DNA-cytosine methylase